MPFIQLPGDSTGKLIETVTPALSSAGSTMHREVMAVGDYASTAIALVTSSGGLQVAVSNPSTSVTITNPSTSVTITNPSTAFNIVGTSGAIAPATSSGGLSVTIVAGAGAGSTAVNITGLSTAIATVTSSAGLMVTISSGLVSITSGTVTLSSVHTVTATAATNPWSSAPSFNVPVVSASSGSAGVFASTGRQYIIHTFNSSSSNSVTVVTTLPAIFYGWNLGNQTTSGAVSVKIYNTSSGAVGSTVQMQQNIPIPGGSAGAGNNFILPQGISCTGGITFAITANFAATSTGSVATNDVVGSLYYNT